MADVQADRSDDVESLLDVEHGSGDEGVHFGLEVRHLSGRHSAPQVDAANHGFSLVVTTSRLCAVSTSRQLPGVMIGRRPLRSTSMDSRLPLLTVETVIFPGLVLPIPVTDVQGRAVIRDLVENGGELVCGALAVRDGYELGERVFRSLYGTGCAATISEITLDPDDDGPVEITLTGNRRFKVAELDGGGDYLVADVEWLDEELGDDPLGTATDRDRTIPPVRRGGHRDQPARPAHRRRCPTTRAPCRS